MHSISRKSLIVLSLFQYQYWSEYSTGVFILAHTAYD